MKQPFRGRHYWIMTDNDCILCRKRGKTWDGSNPRCAFTRVEFSSQNWNCATANTLRELTRENVIYNDDQHCGVKSIMDYADFLIVTWYKNRGKVDGIWLMKNDKIWPINIFEAEAIIHFYNDRINNKTIKIYEEL